MAQGYAQPKPHEVFGNRMQIAKSFRIRERRSELKMTQADLGAKCHLHRTFIGSVERGERNIAILNLRLLARALRMPLAKLFEETEK